MKVNGIRGELYETKFETNQLGHWRYCLNHLATTSHCKNGNDMGVRDSSISGKTIVIDPGHGGPDGGAVGKDETSEKDIALSVSKKLQQYLQQSGALVYLTREK